MTRASLTNRLGSRIRALIAVSAAAIALGTGLACDRHALAPKEVGPDGRAIGRIAVVVPVGSLQATTVVVTVSAADIVPSMVFNFPVVAGVAFGSIAVPAGTGRLVTVSAFDGATETHRGTKVMTIVAGTNASTSITLTPLAGTVTITATFGTVVITITPLTASPKVGDTLRFGATIRDASGAIVPGPARWATTNPAKVTIDTAGLATVLDTGSVLVVATFSTSAATASLTLQPAAGGFVPGFLRTWVGGAGTGTTRNDWATANNWNPSVVPTANDSVVIGVATNQPSIPIDTFSVRDLVLRTGGTLSAVCCGQVRLRIGRVASGEGGGFGSFFGGLLMQNGSSLRGNLQTLVRLFPVSTVVLLDSTRIGSFSIDTTGAVLDLNGKRLVVTSNSTVRAGGMLKVDRAADTLDLLANLDFQSNAAPHVGVLSAGVVILRGAQYSWDGYAGTGSQVVVFAGLSPQNVYSMDYVARPTNTLPNVVLAGAGTVTFNHYNYRITGSLTVQAGTGTFTSNCVCYPVRVDGPLTTAAGSVVGGVSLLMDLRDPTGTANVLGAWNPAYTDFNTANQTIKAGLTYQNVRLYASQALADSVRVAGDLSVNGATTVLNITAPRHIITNTFSLNAGGTFSLDQPGDTLEVHAAFSTASGGNTLGMLTDGVVLAWGDVDGTHYSGTGKHQLVLAGSGTGAQRTIGFNSGATPPTGLSFLKVANAGGHDVCYYGLKIDSGYAVTTAVPVVTNCGGYNMDIGGPITMAAGSAMNVYQVTMRHPTGTANVLGTWNPSYTDIAVANAKLRPNLQYGHLRFFASDTLPAGPMSITGDLIVDGVGTNLVWKGTSIAVAGRFTTQTSGHIVMNAGDALTVAGDVNFNSGVQSLVTGGVLNLNGTNNYLLGFTGSNAAKLRMGNLVQQGQLYGTSGRPIPRLEVNSPFGLLLSDHMVVTDSFTVTGTGPTAIVRSAGGYTFEVQGGVNTVAGSTVIPYAFNLAGTSSLANVSGTFAPGILRIVSNNPTPIRNAPGIQFSDVEIYVPLTLADTLTTTPNSLTAFGTFAGTVTLFNAGTIFDLNGKQVRLSGGLDANTNAILKMANPLDLLILGDGTTAAAGYLRLDAGTNSILTAGTTILRGNAYFLNVTSGAGHTMVFTDSGLTAGTRSYRMDYPQTMGNWVVRGSSGLTLIVDNDYALLGNLDLQGGVILKDNCQNTIRVAGQLRTAAGTTVTNSGCGFGIAMEVQHPTGTSLVNGLWQAGITRFATANAIVKPSLAYTSIEFTAANAIPSNLTLTGSMAINSGTVSLGHNHHVIAGNLTSTGTASVIAYDSSSTIVGGAFSLGNGATITMGSNLDTLAVGGNFSSDNSLANSTVTAGIIRVRGDINASRLNPTGSSTMVVDSNTATAQPVSFYTNITNMNRLRVLTNRFVRFDNHITFNDSVLVLSPTSVGYPAAVGYNITLNGPLVTVPSSTIANVNWILNHTSGTSQVNGVWAANITRFAVAGAVIKPTLAYQQLECTASCSFSGPTNMSGGLFAYNNGTVMSTNGRQVVAAGNFQLFSGAILSMTSQNDTLAIGGTFVADGGSNSIITDGVIRVRGNVQTFRLNPTGASKLVLDSLVSGSNQDVYSQDQTLNRLQILTNRNVTFQSNNITPIRDSLIVSTPVQVGVSTTTLALNGPVSTVTGSTLNPLSVQLNHASAAANILGTVVPTAGLLQMGGVGATIPVGARFTYRNFTVLSNASVSLPVGVTLQLGTGPSGGNLPGDLTMQSNSVLTVPSTSTLRVCRDFNVTTGVSASSVQNLGTIFAANVPAGALGLATFTTLPTIQACP